MRGSIPLTVLVFALLAPGLAALVLTLGLNFRAILASPEFLNMVFWMLPAAYLLGTGPALVVGLGAVWLSPRIAQGWLWVLLVVLTAAAVAGIAGFLIDPGGERLNAWGTFQLVGPPTAIACFLCALACLRLRPRPA